MSQLADRDITLALAAAGIHSATVVSRAPNPKASSSSSEIVTCTLPGGNKFSVLCKYPSVRPTGVAGHWRGIEYEARVYRDVLNVLEVTSARFVGVARTPSGLPALLLEYISDDASSVGLRSDGVSEAAAWLGSFHRRAAALESQHRVDFLQRFDREYLLGWATRTLDFVGSQGPTPSWLTGLVAEYNERLGSLVDVRPTVVHGEYYRENILVHGARVVPVDWESAAVGAGEIDLAALTEGWGDDIATLAKQAYSEARWPDTRPSDLDQALWLARLYLHFRWLGDRPGAAASGDGRWRMGELRQLVGRASAADERWQRAAR